jgi:hypothetical protein
MIKTAAAAADLLLALASTTITNNSSYSRFFVSLSITLKATDNDDLVLSIFNPNLCLRPSLDITTT